MVASLVQIYEESREKLSVLSRVQGIIKNESSFRAIMDNIKEGVCAMSEDGGIYFANISALNILGYKSIDESQSKKIFDIAESDFADFKAEFKEKQKVKAKIVTATAKDKSPVDVLLTPIFKEDEQMVGIIFQGI